MNAPQGKGKTKGCTKLFTLFGCWCEMWPAAPALLQGRQLKILDSFSDMYNFTPIFFSNYKTSLLNKYLTAFIFGESTLKYICDFHGALQCVLNSTIYCILIYLLHYIALYLILFCVFLLSHPRNLKNNNIVMINFWKIYTVGPTMVNSCWF